MQHPKGENNNTPQSGVEIIGWDSWLTFQGQEVEATIKIKEHLRIMSCLLYTKENHIKVYREEDNRA